MKTSQTSNSNSIKKPDYANLERNLILLEKKKDKETSINNDIATLIAYQQMLCSHLGIVYTNLSNVLPQTRRPFPALPFSKHSISMPQTCDYTKLLINITKLLWAAVASKSESADIFFNVHKKFNTLILTRNKFISMNPGPRLSTSFKELNDGQNTNNNKINDSFTKAFNLTINRSEKLDDTFLPTNSDLQEIEQKVGSEPTDEKLKSFYEDLSITEKELFNYISDIIKMQSTGTYFKQFPDLALVKEIPRYTEALSSIGRNTIYVRKELNAYSKTISNTLQYLKDVFEKFENCFALPQIRFDVIKHLVSVESQHYTVLRKVNFFNLIIKKAHIIPPHEWTSLKFLENERDFFNNMISLIKSGNFDEVSNLIEAHLDTFAKDEIKNEIRKESKAVNDSKDAADKSSKEWLLKSTKENTNDSLAEQKMFKNYQEAQKEVEGKEVRNNLMREDIYNNLINTIGRTKQLIYRLSDEPVIPPTFEMKMNKLIDEDARVKSLKMKVDALRKEVTKKKEEIEKLKRQSETLDKHLQQKKDEFEGYKQKSANNKNVIMNEAQSLEEFEKFKDAYFCLYHSKERRETFLKECKHSFCKKDLKLAVKERNRRCPYCHEPFNPTSDIIDINWNKGHK